MAHARVGELRPPPPRRRRIWKTYEPVPVADLSDLVLDRLTAPASWPDFGSDHGRFTPLRPGGLLDQPSRSRWSPGRAPAIPS